jgi:hypothetical protein
MLCSGLKRQWAVLVLGTVMLSTGCVTLPSPAVHALGSGLMDRSVRVQATEVALVSPTTMAAHAVTGNAVHVDAFEYLLTLAGLDNLNDALPQGASLTSQKAAMLLEMLMNKPVTLGSFPPRLAVCHLLREVLEEGDFSHEELQRRVERFKPVVVLRPDGYLAWTLNGHTQQKVGPLKWMEGSFRAGPFELGRFYTSKGGVFRYTDARLHPDMRTPPLAEVYDDADLVSRSFDGAEESFVELYHALGQVLTHPSDSLAALQHLPAAVVALLVSSPQYRERLRYMTHGEQVKAISKLLTQLLVTFGTAGGMTTTVARSVGGLEATLPVLSLSAEGSLVLEHVVVPVGSMATVLGGGPSAALILYQTGTGSDGGSGKRISGAELEKLRQEFETAKSKFWKHEASNRPDTYSPENLARMKQGRPPIGADGFPMELHHKVPLAEGGTNVFENLVPLTRTEHRLGVNYKLNHPNLP